VCVCVCVCVCVRTALHCTALHCTALHCTELRLLCAVYDSVRAVRFALARARSQLVMRPSNRCNQGLVHGLSLGGGGGGGFLIALVCPRFKYFDGLVA
jgi:hypothetical protein